MNIQLFGCCACVVALSVCVPGSYALLVNGSSSLDDSLNSVVYRYEAQVEEEEGKLHEKLYSGENEVEAKAECTDRSINDFPNDWFKYQQRRHGAVALHAFLAFYCFLLTAFVCHDYLLPALDRICASMNISTDVAGATFLAMASSFPEMFVNVIGTFLTESDLGTGTVVGSAVFDTFATPACGALTAFHAITLEWRILSRDCIMYVISVGTLAVVMWDRRIVWYEATILLVLLCSYLMLLFCGKRIMLCCGKIVRFGSTTKLFNVDENSSPNGSYKPHRENLDAQQQSRRQQVEAADIESLGNAKKLEEHSKRVNLFAWPKERSSIGKCWFMVCWPLKFLMFVTIPDSRSERLKHWYPLTFIMCVVWIAISSYLISWMMTVIGDTIGIPDSIMGISFLAAGGNMPEVASIVILARQGDGNMAMSNTLGANILDILLCLGLPWTIKCLMTGKDVEIVSGALSFSVLSMLICIVILYAVIAYFGFKLNKKVGFICLLLYTIFLVFAILVELNVFFFVNLPMCD